MKVEQDPLTSDNGRLQQIFNDKMSDVLKFCSKNNPNYHIQDKVLKFFEEYYSSEKFSYENKKRNASYFASEFREMFRKHYSKKSLVNVFEKVSAYFWILDDEDKRETHSVLKGFNISCSQKCKNSFIPRSDIIEKELNETGFYVVDKKPDLTNTMAYVKRIFENETVSEESQKRILYFLDKHRAVYKKTSNSQSLFGQNKMQVNSKHKDIVKGILDIYKDRRDINPDFLRTLVMQTNFNDVEAKKIEEDFGEHGATVRNAIIYRRHVDIRRLNNYIIDVKKNDEKDKLKMASHRSVYLSMLCSSLIDGNDINDVELDKAYETQLKHLQKMHKLNCKNEEKNLFNAEKQEQSYKNVEEGIVMADNVEIDALYKQLDTSRYLQSDTYAATTMCKNLSSLEADKKEMKYSVYGVIQHFDR